MLVSSTNSILKADLSDNVSTFVENSNQTNGMGWDQQGRLISVQRGRGNEKVGVLYRRQGHHPRRQRQTSRSMR